MKPLQIPGIPSQIKGSFHDTESQKNFDSSETAARNFEVFKHRFFSINEWKNYCKNKSADFKLYDPEGNHITRFPQENDLIRIDIPGPGNPESKGFEWVKIKKMGKESPTVGEIENFIMICVPANDPKIDNSHIAHFYSEKSSSNFRISRGSKYIKIGIYGRNETPNMNTNLTGIIRNLMIAVGGMFGMSKIQWKVFADEIVKF